MREIKFRAWYQNKMVFDIEKHHMEHNELSGFGGDVWDFKDWLKYSKVMQYTGLKDKNGVEIYEGDIVEFSRWNSPNEDLEDYLCTGQKKIVWGLNYGQFPNAGWSAISLRPADLEEGHTLNTMDARNMTVVGNIHENPELLKQ